MARVFSDHDLAVIAGAFRPVTPTEEQPSLVWNSSGDRLLQSTKVLQKFDKLLLDDRDRIALSSLPRSLDVRQTVWCIATQQDSLVYSSDRHAILPRPEVDRLLANILESAQRQYVELQEFLHSRDVDRASFVAALEKSGIEPIYEGHGKGSKTWIAVRAFHAETRNKIATLLKDSPDDHKTDLSASLPDIPRSVLRQSAEEIAQSQGIKGTIRSGKTRITFLSAAYEAMLKEQQAKKIAREFAKILVHTHRYGYHTVPEDNDPDSPGLREVFFERTKAGLDDGSFSMIRSGGQPIALAFTNQLEVVLDEMKVNASQMMVESWKATGAVHTAAGLDPARLEKLIDESSSKDFARLLLQDEIYRSAIQDVMQTKLDELEGIDLQQCNEAFNEYVRVPIRLYLSGLNDVHDANLRQRLEDYVLEYLSKDLVPQGLKHTFDEKQSRNNTMSKEMEKFAEFCLAANSLYELQSGLSRFARKQKLEHIPLDEELAVKKRVLEQKLRSMKRMIRGSDILQNLVWILLAQEYQGLFISSGRDTTRMIRFYQINGDGEIGAKLDAWKDRFKAGQESREDFEEMRALAEAAVRHFSLTEAELEQQEDAAAIGQSHAASTAAQFDGSFEQSEAMADDSGKDNGTFEHEKAAPVQPAHEIPV